MAADIEVVEVTDHPCDACGAPMAKVILRFATAQAKVAKEKRAWRCTSGLNHVDSQWRPPEWALGETPWP